jgi:hypothetical protein
MGELDEPIRACQGFADVSGPCLLLHEEGVVSSYTYVMAWTSQGQGSLSIQPCRHMRASLTPTTMDRSGPVALAWAYYADINQRDWPKA